MLNWFKKLFGTYPKPGNIYKAGYSKIKIKEVRRNIVYYEFCRYSDSDVYGMHLDRLYKYYRKVK